ncbi:hypothetical protein SLEP1_g41405 [Rubroshorea leprosula]|uniref:Uncharacterized protein n=1 Tax=Rubroshorea leprosula TaxID=152421 RepID=A0AAV5L6F7_9ROSI|nr:hypothetical protein SLEP1_g41405 [Rubroshorea leprosula]
MVVCSGKKRQLKVDLKTQEAENGKLKDEIIESLKVANKAEQGQLTSKLENLEKELASTKQSNAESNTRHYVGGKGTRNRQLSLLSYRNR